MNNISIIILTKNEEKHLRRAIESVSFSDDIIVIDDNSDDKTKEVAKSLNTVFINHPLNRNFAQQRNFAMNHAKYDWIFFLDADEEMSKELKQEIIDLVANENSKKYYFIKRRDYFWGHEMKFGEVLKVKNNGLIRLIQKGSGVWTGRIHEEFIPNMPEVCGGILNGYIEHFPHSSISDFIGSVNFYSSIRAEELFSLHKKFGIIGLITFPAGKFMLNYVFYLGFLDGAAGFVYSFLMSFHSFLVRAKLFQLNNVKK